MLETYTIDTALLGNIKRRMSKRAGTIIAICLSVLYLPMLFDKAPINLEATGFALFLTIVVSIYGFKSAIKRQTNSFKTLKIVLNDEGIERKAELLPYKKIGWTNLQVIEKPNGGILVYDKNISKFNRWMYGKGCIYIQPETLDKDKLLSSMRLKAPYAF